MSFFYKGVQKSYLEGEQYAALYRSGFAREHSSKAACLATLDTAALPIDTEIAIEKIYRMKRGYEPNAPFRSGEVAEYWTFSLKESATWHDPKTGKGRPNQWTVTGHSVRKNSSEPFKDTGSKLRETTMPRRTSRNNTPESAGSQYATDQIASEHFSAWVRDQMLEASQADPSEQLPLKTKADARVIAGNMLKQLEWDTKRELRGRELTNLIGSGARPGDSEPRPSDVAGFYDGFRKACDNSRDWLADELLTIKGEMGEARTSEMRASNKRVADMTETELVAAIRDCERRLKDPNTTEALRQSLLYRLENCRAELMVRGRGTRESRRPKAVGSVRRRA